MGSVQDITLLFYVWRESRELGDKEGVEDSLV